MSTELSAQNLQHTLARIDAIIRELEGLRRELYLSLKERPTQRITEALFGAAGQGQWEEYDLLLDWARFSA